MFALRAIVAASVLFFAVAHAGETVRIDCLNLLVEKDADVLLISRGDKSYIIGGGEADGGDEFVKLLDDLSRDALGDQRLMEFIAAENEAVFFRSMETAEKTLTSVTNSPLDGPLLETTKKEINRLNAAKAEDIAKRARLIRDGDRKLHADEARRRARAQLQGDSDFVWKELQIRQKKAELASHYEARLRALGLDLYAPPERFTAAVKSLDPFAAAGYSERRFPLGRGEKIHISAPASQIEKKFQSHGSEFTPPLRSAEEYWNRVTQFAQSEDPSFISFTATGGHEETMFYKYDPKNNVLLVASGDRRRFITLFRPIPRSAENPRGYVPARLTPLQYVLSKKY